LEKLTAHNIQYAFLNSAGRFKFTVHINLMNGSTLGGRIKSFDKFSVLMDSNGQDYLIFKHAISTISLERRS
jgi:host factor-I protein